MELLPSSQLPVRIGVTLQRICRTSPWPHSTINSPTLRPALDQYRLSTSGQSSDFVPRKWKSRARLRKGRRLPHPQLPPPPPPRVGRAVVRRRTRWACRPRHASFWASASVAAVARAYQLSSFARASLRRKARPHLLLLRRRLLSLQPQPPRLRLQTLTPPTPLSAHHIPRRTNATISAAQEALYHPSRVRPYLSRRRPLPNYLRQSRSQSRRNHARRTAGLVRRRRPMVDTCGRTSTPRLVVEECSAGGGQTR